MNVEQLKFTNHALKRIKERFNLKENSRQAILNYCKGQLRHAKRIGIVVSDDGKEAVLYAIGRQAYYLTPDETEVITVMRHEKITYNPIKDKIKVISERELRKLDRKEKSKCKYLELVMLEADLELSELKYRLYKTRSKAVKMACQARIKALEMRLQELKDEINQIKKEKTKIAKSMVAVL